MLNFLRISVEQKENTGNDLTKVRNSSFAIDPYPAIQIGFIHLRKVTTFNLLTFITEKLLFKSCKRQTRNALS